MACYCYKGLYLRQGNAAPLSIWLRCPPILCENLLSFLFFGALYNHSCLVDGPRQQQQQQAKMTCKNTNFCKYSQCNHLPTKNMQDLWISGGLGHPCLRTSTWLTADPNSPSLLIVYTEVTSMVWMVAKADPWNRCIFLFWYRIRAPDSSPSPTLDANFCL